MTASSKAGHLYKEDDKTERRRTEKNRNQCCPTYSSFVMCKGVVKAWARVHSELVIIDFSTFTRLHNNQSMRMTRRTTERRRRRGRRTRTKITRRKTTTERRRKEEKDDKIKVFNEKPRRHRHGQGVYSAPIPQPYQTNTDCHSSVKKKCLNGDDASCWIRPLLFYLTT